MATVEILLCGGPGHGDWVPVPVGSVAHYVRRLKPQGFSMRMDEPFKMDMEEDIYDIQPMSVAERKTVLVGIHRDVMPLDRERMIAKALFQRDVYARIYGPER